MAARAALVERSLPGGTRGIRVHDGSWCRVAGCWVESLGLWGVAFMVLVRAWGGSGCRAFGRRAHGLWDAPGSELYTDFLFYSYCRGKKPTNIMTYPVLEAGTTPQSQRPVHLLWHANPNNLYSMSHQQVPASDSLTMRGWNPPVCRI